MPKKNYPVVLDNDDDGMVFARCDELHANAEGRTEEEAKANIKESIALMVECLKKDEGFSLEFVHKY